MGSRTTGAVHLDLKVCIHVWLFEFRGVAVIDELLFTWAEALNPGLWGIWLWWLQGCHAQSGAGIIPLIPFANECKLWSMPWSSNVNCFSLNPSELEIWRQIQQMLEILVLRLKLWDFSLSVSFCVYPRFSGDWPSSCWWCQACSTGSCDSVLCGGLWQQKEGEMVQTKETGQKRKLDH